MATLGAERANQPELIERQQVRVHLHAGLELGLVMGRNLLKDGHAALPPDDHHPAWHWSALSLAFCSSSPVDPVGVEVHEDGLELGIVEDALEDGLVVVHA